MSNYVFNTSPIQYFHQIGRLDLLTALLGKVIVTTAVVQEIALGMELGLDLPDLKKLDYIEIRDPTKNLHAFLKSNLGAGEISVIALALEKGDITAVLDDRPARRTAVSFGIPITGTLGLLLDAKNHGLIQTVEAILDELMAKRFRLSANARDAILRLSGEKA